MKLEEDLSMAAASGSLPGPRRRPRLPHVVAAAAVGLAVLAAGIELSGDRGSITTVDTVAPPQVRTSDPTVTTTAPPSGSTAAPTAPPPEVTTPARLERSSRLRLDGIGPVTWGMTLEEASKAAGVAIRINPRSDLGRGCAYAKAEGFPGLDFMVIDGIVVRADAGPGIATLSGIRIGSTEEDVLATYPGRIRTERHPYTGHEGGHYLVYVPSERPSQDFGLLFETDGETVTTFRAGLAGPVSFPEGCS